MNIGLSSTEAIVTKCAVDVKQSLMKMLHKLWEKLHRTVQEQARIFQALRHAVMVGTGMVQRLEKTQKTVGAKKVKA